ncbi:transporter substrate-binding domain-containing protein [Bosea lathyri]|uniref:Octopine/nopaline transport system substrate-binding protein n=1 Tax=Bosea lathyri TaxID=1036778 RepID=A0A1H6D9L9_9HYPH|nr:transporter substrate-binding domain-containing protein [Bosea lathyri]SEG81882.1 octopine/nopaline transport system substrate-binding protein [Bosea lathyri]
MTSFNSIIAAVAVVGLLLGHGANAQEKQWTKITIGTEGSFAPWNYEEGGKLKGLEIDLAEDICRRAKLECSFIVQDFDGLIPALNVGKIDAVMSGMSATAKRAEVIAFSQPYATGGQTFGIQKGGPLEALPFKGELINLNDEASALDKIEKLKAALKGKTIGVQAASINASFLDRYLKGIVDVREYKATTQHDLDLSAGRIDAIVASYNYILDAAKKPGNRDMLTAGPRFIGGVFGNGSSIGLRKSDVKLKAMLDEALIASFADGTYKNISEKYFGYDATPQYKR